MASATAVRPVVSALVGPVSARPRPLVRPVRPDFRLCDLRVPPLTEPQLLARYPHMIPGTLRRDPVANKNAVDIRCACGAVRIVYTSDLFHVRACRACKASGK
jgi:hypothetical protein